MEFSPQQQVALDRVREWLGTPGRQVFRLFGYAGTGKTTLAKHLGADLYAAYTGKAAHVLQSKGCPASTIHSLIYLPREKSTQRLQELAVERDLRVARGEDVAELEARINEKQRNLRRPSFTLNLDSPLQDASLLVIDECSMVDKEMGEDLLSFGTRVLVLGDPAQLPPVRGGGYFTNHEPDVLLTEIHRQARGNPILDLATKVRTSQQWADHPCVSFIKPGPDKALAADQIIVGTNKLRHKINRRIRQLKGYDDPLPVVGDKVVCIRNNHNIGIMNGATYTVTDVQHDDNTSMIKIDNWMWVRVHREPFQGRDVDYWRRMDAEEFEYGYALTCHKAQGSQWDSVLVYDESYVFRGSSQRWLYTAITRAAKQLTVVV